MIPEWFTWLGTGASIVSLLISVAAFRKVVRVEQQQKISQKASSGIMIGGSVSQNTTIKDDSSG